MPARFLPEAISLSTCAFATYALLFLSNEHRSAEDPNMAVNGRNPCPPGVLEPLREAPRSGPKVVSTAAPSFATHIRLPTLSALDRDFLAEPSGTRRYTGLDNIRRELLQTAQRLTTSAAKVCASEQRRDPASLDPASVRLALDVSATVDSMSINTLRELTVVTGAPVDPAMGSCIEKDFRKRLPWRSDGDSRPISTVRARKTLFADFSGEATVQVKLGRCRSCE
jgi:hypothetical protein